MAVKEILVLYYSVGGSVRELAELVVQGIERVPGAAARLRTVPRIDANDRVAKSGPPHAELSDLEACAGLALGSPTRFGNMAAPLKHFLDGTGAEWASGTLVGKPAAFFTSTSSMHGGQESTLLSMMLPLLHHGAVIVGIPYTEPLLHATRTGGTPYGASHVSGLADDRPVSDTERALAIAQGKRLAELAMKLSQ